MKVLCKFIAALVTGFLLTACDSHLVKGNGNVVVQQRSLQAFKQLVVDGDFVVVVNAHESQNLHIKTDSNVQSYVITEVEQGVLHIHVRQGYHLRPSVPIEINMRVKQLSDIALHGKVNVTATKLSGKTLALKVTGDSKVVVDGALQVADYEVTEAAQVDAAELVAHQVRVRVNGMGKVMVNVKHKLEVFIKGLGKVTYFGDPPIINQEIYDGGQLIKGRKSNA